LKKKRREGREKREKKEKERASFFSLSLFSLSFTDPRLPFSSKLLLCWLMSPFFFVHFLKNPTNNVTTTNETQEKPELKKKKRRKGRGRVFFSLSHSLVDLNSLFPFLPYLSLPSLHSKWPPRCGQRPLGSCCLISDEL
jgi:hypothetical protein